ncbi:LacI family DNA-binding transcriptional regulator [Natronogracilivirga saccharolytica]|uniref:LacI family DNA-binding transcriptional regulator n=1 Tax=Natronogracilivirga saccharolytica TaxID=2812953 RepID=A0A8J7RMV4_9BACT|nr:LacI family DNA-binding transcriptional regulator [Natronogracilivirga saccharolytica]MBP3193890.1 LacI family DNA-binding transcriptional regulator [Natronogracilivirga saccharolytica]
MKKKTTLNDIAKTLKLTKVSISKALRDHPDISEQTRIKVKQLAQEMGYRPNLIARSLTSSKSKTIGVVVPKIAHNFFAHVVGGIQKIADKYDYEILLTVSDENEELEKQHIESLVAMQVDGLLVSVSMETKNTEIYQWIREMQIPLVFFDRYIPDLGFNSVIINDKEAARNGVEEMIMRGSKKIAHLAGYEHISIGKERRLGYKDALEKQGIEYDPSLVVEGGFGENSGYHGFKELASRGVEFDSIFAVTFPVGLGSYIAMREVDANMIDNIAMLAFGDSGVRGILPYPRYYVDQPGMDIGKKATELLLKEINGVVEPENKLVYMDTQFVETGKNFPVSEKNLLMT